MSDQTRDNLIVRSVTVDLDWEHGSMTFSCPVDGDVGQIKGMIQLLNLFLDACNK